MGAPVSSETVPSMAPSTVVTPVWAAAKWEGARIASTMSGKAPPPCGRFRRDDLGPKSTMFRTSSEGSQGLQEREATPDSNREIPEREATPGQQQSQILFPCAPW